MKRAMKLMCVVAAAAPCALFADTYTWVGGDGDFAELSNWQLASPGSAPDLTLAGNLCLRTLPLRQGECRASGEGV